MSELLVTSIYNQEGEGAPSFPKGATSTGVITATSFSGSGANLTGIDATALKDDSGSVKIQANSDGAVVTGVITATTGSFTGNVSVGGTLTYEDVTNIDSVGIITARNGVDFKGVLREKVKITAGKLSDNTQINLDDGMVHFFTTQETTTSTPNITSSVGINTIMAVGDTMTLSVITTAAAGAYSANWKVDHTDVTEAWNGGAAPAAGGAAGKDFYTLNIIKTGNAAFTVLGNVSNFA